MTQTQTVQEIMKKYGLHLSRDTDHTTPVALFQTRVEIDDFKPLADQVNPNSLKDPAFRKTLREHVSLLLFYDNHCVIDDAKSWKQAFNVSDADAPYPNFLLNVTGVFGIVYADRPLEFSTFGFLTDRLKERHNKNFDDIYAAVCPAFKLKHLFQPEQAYSFANLALAEKREAMNALLNRKETEPFLDELVDAVLAEWAVVPSVHWENRRQVYKLYPQSSTERLF